MPFVNGMEKIAQVQSIPHYNEQATFRFRMKLLHLRTHEPLESDFEYLKKLILQGANPNN